MPRTATGSRCSASTPSTRQPVQRRSFGKSGIQAWFLDDDYDGTVFRVSQAFFPVTDAWDKLERALRSTVDAALLDRTPRLDVPAL